MTETQKYINTALTDNGITVSDDKTGKLAAYLDELLRVNTYMNDRRSATRRRLP